MKTRTPLALALLLCVGALGAAPAQDETPSTALGTGERRVRRIKAPVKQYKALDRADVYQAAINGLQANVRFQDVFSRSVPVPADARHVQLGSSRYDVVFAFRTEGDLLCLTPAASSRALRAIFGVPANQPLSAAILQRPTALIPGQQLTVTGTVLGIVEGEKTVLADGVYLDSVAEDQVQREVYLFTPGLQQPQLVSKPTKVSFEFFCSHKKDALEKLFVTVTAMSEQQVADKVAAITARLEGLRSASKTYGHYDPLTVYRRAGGDVWINVDFTDKVKRVYRYPFPPEISSMPALRNGVALDLETAHAFQTASRITCLVPATWPTVVRQASRLVPGEELRVRGVTIGARGTYNCVAVDYLGFPGRARDTTWWVDLRLAEDSPATSIWDVGSYNINTLPCQNVPGAIEPVRVMLTEFRTIEIPLPPLQAQPQNNSEGAEGGAK
ncbi:MAG: hypothetical protein J7M08_07315 [Planctomycetes bacterium]|nr:hypothetical protein [Planctomycetota bacterium]